MSNRPADGKLTENAEYSICIYVGKQLDLFLKSPSGCVLRERRSCLRRLKNAKLELDSDRVDVDDSGCSLDRLALITTIDFDDDIDDTPDSPSSIISFSDSVSVDDDFDRVTELRNAVYALPNIVVFFFSKANFFVSKSP